MNRDLNSNLNLEEYGAGCAKLKSLPRYILVELTRGCNLRCPMCRSGVVKPSRMQLQLFSEISEKLFHTAEIVDLRGWGESLILSDIKKYMDVVHSKGARSRFVTNLSFNLIHLNEYLAENNVLIDISFDAILQSTATVVRPGSNTALMLSNLRNLKNAYKAAGNLASIRTHVTLQAPALEEAHILVGTLMDEEIKEITIGPVWTHPSSPLSLSSRYTETQAALARIKTEATKRAYKNLFFSGSFSPQPRPVRPQRCLHPWAYFCIDSDGTVGFCDHLIGSMPTLPRFGHWDDGFEALWNGEQWQSLRSWHVDHDNKFRKSQACESCSTKRCIDFEHWFAPSLSSQRMRFDYEAALP